MSRKKIEPRRCKLSPAGVKDLLIGRVGTIIGISNDGRNWWVLWEGNKQANAYWKGYIEIINQ